MDSTLLDQIRHLCRDRAAYERLKAILVQQERVHQLSWEERYEKLMSTQDTETETANAFSNIIAREKALAHLADAIQRSPSLELVLQVAVQVAQKLLQVDRVAIFRRHPDGRGEFITDAIASGISSIADMPERQLLLARHMVDSMQTEQSAQTIDNIRSSSLSSHIVTLLEQIGISSYAANKIYAGHEVWGTLVAFHGTAYHVWSESDRTSLSLVTAQIGIAISLANLRQQSQTLADDLQALKVELDSLQKTVTEIIESETQPLIAESSSSLIPNIEEPIITMFSQDVTTQDLTIDDYENSGNSDDLEHDRGGRDLEGNAELISQVDQLVDQGLDEVISESEEAIEDITNEDEFIDSEYIAISHNGLPRLFLIQDVNTSVTDGEKAEQEEITVAESEEFSEPEAEVLETLEIKNLDSENPVEPEILDLPSPTNVDSNDSEQEAIAPESLESITSESQLVTEVSDLEPLALEALVSPKALDLESIKVDDSQQEAITTESLETTNNETQTKLEANAEQEVVIEIKENIEQESLVDHVDEPTFEVEINAPVVEQEQREIKDVDGRTEVASPSEQEGLAQADLETSKSDTYDDDREPAIEPQFIETILSIAGNDSKGISFLLNVIDSYLEETPRLVQAIDKAIAVNDHPRLLQTLNTLRSSSDYIGALPLSYQCRHLESAVRANYVVLIYACLSQVAIEAQRATEALRIERSRYA